MSSGMGRGQRVLSLPARAAEPTMDAAMTTEPLELRLSMTPRSRYDAIDVARRVAGEVGSALGAYRRLLYCSHHTTAGFLDQGLARRLEHRRDRLDPFIRIFQRLFPEGAGYRHDELELRRELSEEQRRSEPKNADAHLTFIGSGLRNCVTYDRVADVPVYFLDLDGVNQGQSRTRTASVVAYSEEEVIARRTCAIPVSAHPIDSVNLSDHRIGLEEEILAMVRGADLSCGRVDIALDPTERDAALTVNEYETLLMRHDLAEVLQDPLRFAAQQGRRMLSDPRAVPVKSLGYAKYDLVQVLKELYDSLDIGASFVERIVARLMAFPASRVLRLKRSVSMAISGFDGEGPQLVRGRYQSPVLLQWSCAPGQARTVHLTLTKFR